MTEILKLSLKDFGNEESDVPNNSLSKNKLKMIINIATEEQINLYLAMIAVLNNYIK